MEVIRNAEVKAVADLFRSGRRPCLGQFVDYAIDPEPAVSSKRKKPYRLTVEQWHLDEAEGLLFAAGLNEMRRAGSTPSKIST